MAAMTRSDSSRYRPLLEAGLEEMGLSLPAGAAEKLLAFVDLLVTWNRAFNLVANADPREIVQRHVLDSLSLVPWVGPGRHLDLGTGAGFPGIPLAIWFPQLAFDLLDGNGKKMRFLFQVKSQLALANVRLHHCRVEALGEQARYDTVLSRAVAPLPLLTALAAPVLAERGRLLAMKAGVADAELNGLPPHWNVVSRIDLKVPGSTQPRQLLVIGRAEEASSP